MANEGFPSNAPLNAAQILAMMLLAIEPQGTFLGGPLSGSGAASFRAIGSADLTTALLTPPPIGSTTAAAGIFAGLTINDPTTQTKQLTFNLAGATAATELTLVSSQTASRTLNIPALTGTDTLATLGLAQTFSLLLTFNGGAAGSGTYRFNGAAAGAFAAGTTTETNPGGIAGWDSLKHNLICGPASSTTSAAIALAYDQGSGIGHIIALTPGVAWRSLKVWCSDFHVNLAGNGNSFSIASTGAALIGGDVLPSSAFPGNVLWGVQNGTADTAGAVGETITSSVTAIAAGATAVTANVTSISLTPGKWLIHGRTVIHGGTTGLTSGSAIKTSIVTVSGGDGVSGNTMTQESVLALLAAGEFATSINGVAINITATTTYYLTAAVSYVAGAPTIDGTLYALRVR